MARKRRRDLRKARRSLTVRLVTASPNVALAGLVMIALLLEPGAAPDSAAPTRLAASSEAIAYGLGASVASAALPAVAPPDEQAIQTAISLEAPTERPPLSEEQIARLGEDRWRMFDDAAWSPHQQPIMPPGVHPPLFRPRPLSVHEAAITAIYDAQGVTETLGRSSIARRAVERMGPLYEDFALWARLRAERGPGDAADWAELTAFLDRRRDWPDQDALHAAAEAAMPQDLPPGEVLDFFGSRTPQTARGARRLGEAMIATGRREDGEKVITEAWLKETLDASEERAFLDGHGPLLQAHHAPRLEMLLLRRHATAATRLAKSIGEDWRALTSAVSALLRNRRGVDQLIGRVPDSLQGSPSLAYARMVWRERKRRASEAEEILLERPDPATLGEPAAWARSRRAHARRAFEDGRFDDAYAIASAHGLERGYDFAELEWFAGWLALRFLDDAEGAARHFESLYDGVGTPISVARAAYWTGRAKEAAGDAAGAAEWYRRASAHPNTFYGQHAARSLGESLRFEAGPAIRTALPGASAPADDVTPDIAIALYRGGRPDGGAAFLDAFGARGPDASDTAIDTALRFEDFKAAIDIAGAARDRGHTRWDALYPEPHAPSFQGRITEAAFLLAVARQESRFRAGARSAADAQGMMQMIESTARASARRAGVPFDTARLGRDAAYGLTLSDAHVQELLERYDGSYLLAAAAYNAGPGAVERWIETSGDPRDGNVDAIDWIESIPYGETRNYVQRILEATVVYRALSGTETASLPPVAP